MIVFVVYYEAASGCNSLDFTFGASAIGTTTATRQFSIKVWLKTHSCGLLFSYFLLS